MLTEQTKPLEFAQRILKPETIKAVARQPYTAQGWKILDRWAYNTPTKLMELEAQGEIILLSRLLEQQNREQQALTDSLETPMAEHEVLQLHQIETELQ